MMIGVKEGVYHVVYLELCVWDVVSVVVVVE